MPQASVSPSGTTRYPSGPCASAENPPPISSPCTRIPSAHHRVSSETYLSPMSDFAQSVKQQADIVKIIGEYVRLKKAGAQNYSGLCPFHKEKSPSFSVHAARQFYHCFGCGVSGDVFSFVGRIENVGFPEA